VTKVRIPPTLRTATGGEREVSAAGETVAEVLDDLTSRFPDLEGQLRYANVYVDGEDIRTLDELETPVREGATIILLPAMAGGSLASQAGTDSRRAKPGSVGA
jgi:molybdopterin synthase sulfur carrier subunit